MKVAAAATVVDNPLNYAVSKLEKFWFYETSTFYYLVGMDSSESQFRMIKMNRLIAKPRELSDIVKADHSTYSSEEIADVLGMIHEGNKTSGGLVKVCNAFGIIGFVKFLDCYYVTLITQRKEAGLIAGNLVYSIKATEMFPIRPRDDPSSNTFRKLWNKLNKKLSQTSAEIAESRYMGLFQFVDMTKDFFFSYSYDLTRSLQHNYVNLARQKERQKSSSHLGPSSPFIDAFHPQEIFEWNHFQLQDLRKILGPADSSKWISCLILGSYQQKRFSLFGKTIDLIMIARRSRHYAGTRYLKRGINVHGKAANDCEIEQVVQRDDGYRSHFCSYLQMRGSIPTYWYQETSVTMPKPPILINRTDPDYQATEEHIADLFRRYSSPIIALDLVKQQEKRPRESLVGSEFRNAVEVVNGSIASPHKVRYIALDYSKITSFSKGKAKAGKQVSGAEHANKRVSAVGEEWRSLVESSLKQDHAAAAALNDHPLTTSDILQTLPSQQQQQQLDMDDLMQSRVAAADRMDVLKELEDVASMTIAETGFFCNTTSYLGEVVQLSNKQSLLERSRLKGRIEQRGVLRTNCIDCLDRTNGAQFAVGMKFLTVSLQALGICNRHHHHHQQSQQQGAADSSSRLMSSLMEMYGEMGDRIALQYGGSEAHRKVPGGQGTVSSSKQNELLTSIKRYYSNAFTDMVKQDAMNVFLGCFVPGEAAIPLWDLESDWELHNLLLRPPSPRVNRVLFHAMQVDSLVLNDSYVRHLVETSVKKALMTTEDIEVALIPLDSVPPEISRKMFDGKVDLRNHLSDYSSSIPTVNASTLLTRYFIRKMKSDSAPSRSLFEWISESTVSSLISSFRITTAELKATIRAIGRLERRRMMREIAASKVAAAAECWWKEALLDYETVLNGNTLSMEPPSPNIYNPQQQPPPSGYFERAYSPKALTEFDCLLSMDFLSSAEAANDLQQVHDPTAKAAEEESRRLSGKVALLDASATERYKALGASAGSALHESPPIEAFDAVHDSSSKSFDGVDELGPEGLDGSKYATAAAEGAHEGIDFGSSQMDVDGVTQNLNSGTSNVNTSAFQLSKYVRRLVGGFLRKDDSTNAPTNQQKHSMKASNRRLSTLDWQQALISSDDYRVPKKTTLMYSRYVSIAQNPLVLMDFTHSQRATEEEYHSLLRDHTIEVDNVAAMEQLAVESCIANEIHLNCTYQGLRQTDSAFTAYYFLLHSIVLVEPFMQACLEQRPDKQLFGAGSDSADRTTTTHVPSGLKPSTSSSSLLSSSALQKGTGTGELSYHGQPAFSTPRKLAQDNANESVIVLPLLLEAQNKLKERIDYCMDIASPALGLAREFRQLTREYLTRQDLYAVDISHDHLANRLSSTISEKTIVQYSKLFDHTVVASDLDGITYIASDSSAYESFSDLHGMRKAFSQMHLNLKQGKQAILDAFTCDDNNYDDIGVGGDQRPTEGPRSGDAQSAHQSSISLSEQLGLEDNVPGLLRDLRTDYSLPYPFDADVATYLLDKQYDGFNQVEHDVYVRHTNPYLLMNEVAVTSFKDALTLY